MSDKSGIVVFDSTQNAMASEELLKKRHFESRILTTPGNISAGCGLSVFFKSDSFQQVKRALKNGNIVFKAIYEADRTGVKTMYKKVEDY